MPIFKIKGAKKYRVVWAGSELYFIVKVIFTYILEVLHRFLRTGSPMDLLKSTGKILRTS